jgi:apolipoprotein N-acyltransferase
MGTLLVDVVPMGGLTPYARWGNYAALMLIAALAAVAISPPRRGP